MRENFSWALFGNLAYGGCQWGLLVILAKIGTPEMVGQLALALAISAPVFVFTNLQLRTVQATDARGDYPFGSYLALRIISTAIAFFTIAGIILMVEYRLDTAVVILFVGLAKGFESLSDIIYGLLQQNERMDFIGKSMTLKGLLSLVGMGLVIYLTGDMIWATGALAAAWLLGLFVFDLPAGLRILKTGPSLGRHPAPSEPISKPSLRPQWEFKTLKRLARFALPLGFAILAYSLRTNTPRYFLERLMGERELGIFAAMSYLGIVGARAAHSLGQSSSPKLAQLFAAKDGQAFIGLFLKMIGTCTILGIAGMAVSWVWGEKILTVVYGSEYAAHSEIFTWMMIVWGIEYLCILHQYSLTSVRVIKVQALLLFVSVAATFLMCIIFLPSRGLAGALLALFVGVLSEFVLSSFIIIRSIVLMKVSSGNGSKLSLFQRHPGSFNQSM